MIHFFPKPVIWKKIVTRIKREIRIYPENVDEFRESLFAELDALKIPY